MKVISAICSAILILFCAGVVFALMPPMSYEGLNRESTNIVRGEITEVVCTGEFEKTRCAKLTGYVATLKVKKTIKGKRYKTLYIYFKEYDFFEGCVGSPDTVHCPGEEALYYLSCKEDKCHLTHWNGIKYKKHGNKSLPKCEPKK